MSWGGSVGVNLVPLQAKIAERFAFLSEMPGRNPSLHVFVKHVASLRFGDRGDI